MLFLLPIGKAKKKRQAGFTLIELLIVTAALAVLLIVTLSRIGNFGSQIELDSEAQKIVSALELARNQTLASEDQTVYGVHFESSKYVLFKGATYDPADTDNREFTLSDVEIYDTSVTGGSDVVFDRIRGTTSNTGDIKIRLSSDTTKTASIVINSLGQSSLAETVASPTTRITDTRHIHLDFGWTMQSSTTMTLIFSDPPNPNVTEAIDIQSNIVSGKFEWEDEVDVNGSTQTLRIHTHLMDGSNTILSVHRDRRFNDKALEIQVDGTTVVSFDAGGSVSAGAINQLTIQ